jgi:hypothetical protein
VLGPSQLSIARKTGRSEDQVLALIGAGFLAVALMAFLRTVRSVIVAGRTDQWLPARRS